jgi:hypothetical protein
MIKSRREKGKNNGGEKVLDIINVYNELSHIDINCLYLKAI